MGARHRAIDGAALQDWPSARSSRPAPAATTLGAVSGTSHSFTANAGTTYQWIIASGTSITNFSADKFVINTSAFFNAPNNVDFTIGQVGNNLVLNYTEFPRTPAILG